MVNLLIQGVLLNTKEIVVRRYMIIKILSFDREFLQKAEIRQLFHTMGFHCQIICFQHKCTCD